MFNSLCPSERCEPSGRGAPGAVGSGVTVMVPQAPLLRGEPLWLLIGRTLLVKPLQGSPSSGNRPSMGTSQSLGFLSNLEAPRLLYAYNRGENQPPP